MVVYGGGMDNSLMTNGNKVSDTAGMVFFNVKSRLILDITITTEIYFG
jgi:hypothetical protein